MIGELIKSSRKSNGLTLKELAAQTGIDQTLLSRYEKGDRLPTEGQLSILSEMLSIDSQKLRVEWLSEKVVQLLVFEPAAAEVFQVAESRIEYLTSNNVLTLPEPDENLKLKLKQIDQLKAIWSDRGILGPSQLLRMHEYFDIAYTYESNKIEGNTLTIQETALVANQGLTIGGKSMREHLEVINHTQAIGFMRELVSKKEDLTKRNLLSIHQLILKEVDSRNAGIYRQVPVRISGSVVVLPQPFMLDKLMDDYFQFYQLHKKRLHPVILAAEIHERLVSIHPFIDGNGRTARLAMNLVLLQQGYTRANIKGEDASRLKYYETLQQVQLDNDRMPFYHLIADETLRSLEEHIELI